MLNEVYQMTVHCKISEKDIRAMGALPCLHHVNHDCKREVSE